MQKILRTLIIIAMLITGYLLILAWRDDYTNVNKPVAITPTTTAVSSNDVPVAGASGTPTGDIPAARQLLLPLPRKRAHSSLA